MKERIWLTWETQRRNRTLSDALNARLHELDYKLPRLRRWLKAGFHTFSILFSERPRVLFAQNPSLVLALLAVWYGRLSGRPTVIDAHNGGIYPYEGRQRRHQHILRRVMRALARHVIRQARVTIVTNSALAAYVESVGGRSAILPDPLPSFPSADTSQGDEQPTVLFICTWAADEPYLEVLRAAAKIDPRIRIKITGKSKGRELALGQPLPPNVMLTGFVPEEEFVELLRSADVVMDLTTLEDCLVCGAYEAVGMGKPMVLSGSRALRAYFCKGGVFTNNTADSIGRAIEQAVAERAQLQAQVAELRAELKESWEVARSQFESLLTELSADDVPLQTVQKRSTRGASDERAAGARGTGSSSSS
jgi:glycosyltransferase involved in cell wall biosynthesis